MLEASRPTDAPEAAVDATLRLGEFRRRYGRRNRNDDNDPLKLLSQTPERRRLTLWRATSLFARHPRLHGKEIDDIWDLRMVGLQTAVGVGDVDWLIQDARDRPEPRERALAASALLQIWRSQEDSDLFARIEELAASDGVICAKMQEWTAPRATSEQARLSQQRIRAREQRHLTEVASHDQSWRDFADQIRANPTALRNIRPTSDGVDARLYHLWQLLTAVGDNRSRYAINDLSALVPMFGDDVVAEFRSALIDFWRHWDPVLPSERVPEKRNIVDSRDCMGMAGVSLEAAADSKWAIKLTHQEAARAAIYATIELNGFPGWIKQLAEAQPEAVRDVLLRSIRAELVSEPEGHKDALSDIEHADPMVGALVIDELLSYVERTKDFSVGVLRHVLEILVNSFDDREALTSLFRHRLVGRQSTHIEVAFLSALNRLNPTECFKVVDSKLQGLRPSGQTAYMQAVLSALFTERWRRPACLDEIPFDTLRRLVETSYRTVRLSDDNDHSDGEAYSPDLRDDAESARSALFRALVDTPGLPTFTWLHQMAAQGTLGIPPTRLRALARERSEHDSEHQAWSPGDVAQFELSHTTAPRSSSDLQRLVVRRIEDLQHDVIHGDYQQGRVLARLEKEVDVQNWLADYLRTRQGRSYTVEREPHVADEKEPDVRFQARMSSASVPMEVKVAESWSRRDLEEALSGQLIG